VWILIPEATTACQELLKCGCKRYHAPRNASADMLGFHAKLFVSVVEHVTVDS